MNKPYPLKPAVSRLKPQKGIRVITGKGLHRRNKWLEMRNLVEKWAKDNLKDWEIQNIAQGHIDFTRSIH